MLALKPGSPSPIILHFVLVECITALLVDIQPICEVVFDLFRATHQNRGRAKLLAAEFA